MSETDTSPHAQLRHRPGRKPADMRLAGRDAVWAAIRRLRTFDVPKLERETRVPQDTIRSYLQGLAAAGFITTAEKRQQRNGRGVPLFQANEYRLLRDVGIDAPRVTRKGEPVKQGLARERTWTAMRALKEFDYRDIVATASTATFKLSDVDVRSYLKHLLAAGYLRVIAEAKPPHSPARYRLLPPRNTGPKAPQVQSIKQVFDPNLGRVVYREDEA